MFFLYTESYDVDGNGMESVSRDLIESQRRSGTDFESDVIDMAHISNVFFEVEHQVPFGTSRHNLPAP